MKRETIDREKLRGVVANINRNILKSTEKNQDWCIACGASYGAAEIGFPDELLEGKANQLIDSDTILSFAKELDQGELNDWCIACGATSGAAPQHLGPDDISDEALDAIEQDLVRTLNLD